MTREEMDRPAAKGEELPKGLNAPDVFYYLSVRALYNEAKYGKISKERGAKEKLAIIQSHEKMLLYERMMKEHRRKEREFEGAWTNFAKNPTLENADALHRAWFNCGIKVPAAEDSETEAEPAPA